MSGARKAGDIAAPRLQQNLFNPTQGSQSLALGLGTIAASQLVELTQRWNERRRHFVAAPRLL